MSGIVSLNRTYTCLCPPSVGRNPDQSYSPAADWIVLIFLLPQGMKVTVACPWHVRSTAPQMYAFIVRQNMGVIRPVSHPCYAKCVHTTSTTDSSCNALVTLQVVHFSCPWSGQILRLYVAVASCQPDSCGIHACQCLPECERQVLARPAQSPIVQVQFCRSRYCPCCVVVWRDTLSRVGYLMLDITIHQSALVKRVPMT